MRVLCVFGQHNYGDPRRGQGYEYTNFIPALRRLGHEILFQEVWSRTCYRDFGEVNRALLHTVEQERPDVILAVLMHYEIWLETWEILRDAGIAATVNWATDDSWKYAQFSRLIAPAFHAYATTYPDIYERYQQDNISNVLLTQWAASDAQLQPPLPAAECQYAVSFVGTAHGKRQEWVEMLKQRGIDVACFGHGWPQGAVDAEDIPRIIRNSIISLNFGNSPRMWQIGPLHQTNQIKARTFEVPGAGGFLLTEWAEGLERHYIPDQEITVFNDPDDLAAKIHYYLTNPAERDAIAQAGYQRTRAEHTYGRRLSELLDFALQQRDRYFSVQPLTCPGGQWQGNPTGQIDWGRFEDVRKQHYLDKKLSALRQGLTAVCSAIWGPVRGPRAARRLTYELSWRLVGARTYSASGWPGRMFYNES